MLGYRLQVGAVQEAALIRASNLNLFSDLAVCWGHLCVLFELRLGLRPDLSLNP